MAAIWDPRAVLDLYPETHSFTCAATTTRRTRCKQRFLSGADLAKASHLLNTIAALPPTALPVLNSLQYLACLTSCPRWHQKPGYTQFPELAGKWQSKIDQHCVTPPRTIPITPTSTRLSGAATAPLDSRRLLPSSSRAVSASSTWTAPATPSAPRLRPVSPAQSVISIPEAAAPFTTPPPHSARSASTQAAENLDRGANFSRPAPNLADEHAGQAPPLQRTRITLSAAVSTAPASVRTDPVPALSQESTIDQGVELLTAALTEGNRLLSGPSRQDGASNGTLPTRESLTSTPPAPGSAVPTSAATNSLRSTPTATTTPAPTIPAPSTPALITPPPTPCARAHGSTRRKPITEDCGICTESISCSDDAVWCRAQCGQNVHRDCFSPWRRRCAEVKGLEHSSLERRLEVVTCVYCRTKWKWEWED